MFVEADGFSYHIPAGLPEITIRLAYLFYEERDVPVKLIDKKKSMNKAIAIVLVGFRPNMETMSAIASFFYSARFRTAFGRDLPARVLACRISLWLKNTDAQFLLLSNRIHFRYRSKAFSCPEEMFSLSRFCRISGLRTNLTIFI
ncbi:hypothetical protein ASU31_00055 [Pedobacter ginsenosidimutans]|uniref:Uncharacterized protein n=1 Tax=Pedobacter ginsenosidimutans TaxID=687842 RepID=A0A0T5VV26_9SPHI|nr:hypothetical protein [Pedobacter ginsenosidimutans]KRT17726.1 hypothetical protein ASU31_00055 [Pedobacter ginsenosidimutans]